MGFLKNGSIIPIDIIHSCRSTDKWTFSAAWLPPLLSVPGLALLGLLVTPSSPGLLSDKKTTVQGNVLCGVVFFFFSSSWVQIVSETEHIITVGLFCFCLVRVYWWYLICVRQLRPWLTSSALDQTRGYYQPGLSGDLCQLLLSWGQWALEWMGLE